MKLPHGNQGRIKDSDSQNSLPKRVKNIIDNWLSLIVFLSLNSNISVNRNHNRSLRAFQKDEPITEKTKDTEISMVWIALKNSLNCRKLQLPSDVHDPEANGNPSTLEKRPGRSRCLGSISNLREKRLGCSTRTLWSSESLNRVTHKIVLDDPTCETKTGPLCVSHKDRDRGKDIGPTFVGDHSHRVPHFKPSGPTSIRIHGGSIIFDGGVGSHICSKIRRSNETDYNGSSTLICQMCGEKFRKLDAIEGHRLSKHSGEHQVIQSSISY